MMDKINKIPTKKELVEYFFTFKKLCQLHGKYRLGKTPHSSSGFTEGLCRHLWPELEKASKGKGCDLLKGKIKIEVKGTTSKNGTTTINPSMEFDYLLWVYLDYKKDKAIIQKIKYESLTEIVKIRNKLKKDSKIGCCISLKKYTPFAEWSEEISFKTSNFKSQLKKSF